MTFMRELFAITPVGRWLAEYKRLRERVENLEGRFVPNSMAPGEWGDLRRKVNDIDWRLKKFDGPLTYQNPEKQQGRTMFTVLDQHAHLRKKGRNDD